MKILRKIDLFQKEINTLRPLEGEILEQIKDYYRVRLTWTSNALEGNSLTENETKVLLEDGLTVGGKPLRDLFEAVDPKPMTLCFLRFRTAALMSTQCLGCMSCFTRM